MRNNDLGDTARPAGDSSFVSRFTGSALKGTKSRAALALAVSLWIATGGVASALRGGPAETTVTVGSGETVQYVYNGEKTDTPPYTGNPTDPTGEKTGYHTVIDGGTVLYDAYGGCSEGIDAQGKGDASYNSVTIKNGGLSKNSVFGGFAYKGSANHNSVTLIGVTGAYGGQVWDADIYGGQADASADVARTKIEAIHNTVSMTDSRARRVYGGFINSYNSTKGANATKDCVTDNTLHLSGANTVSEYVKNFETINIENVKWGTPVLTFSEGANGILQNTIRSGEAQGSWATIDASKLTFANPETIQNGASMNLIAGPVGDVTLATTTTALQEYTVTPVTGVLVNAALHGQLSIPGGKDALIYTASNKATKLTFTDVEWKDSGALLDHATTLTNVSFDGADVDTTNINFTNLQSLEANKKMTLVSSFGDTVGTITGTKYKVGSTLEGEGKASLVGNDLIFTAETKAGGDEPDVKVQEQTHNTVMGAEVGMAALSAGNDFVGAATEGLALASNIGADGVSSFAQMGGGSMRQETGSHVDAHTWNAILALGHQNKKERGTFEYGAFFEYGTGNYSTFNGDERGDGSMHYTGGGLLAKYTRANGVYVEGSLRAGTVHDDARNVLRDFRGMPYSYETNANYMGFHLGVGKEIAVAGGNAVDVYGRYFYNRRNGVSFDAGGHYDLDAVTSSVLRVGARYIMKRNKWNFYAGAAYEHELDGKASGTADGVAIRGADTSGASFRGELGATMKPGENSPWSLDLNVSGFAGKKQGFTGGVSVAFMF